MQRTHAFKVLATLLLISIAQRAAYAHFIWVDLDSTNHQPQFEVYFGEMAVPGDEHLIGKIAHTKAWLRDAKGQTTDVALKAQAENAKAALTANCTAAAPTCLEAFCDYGVYSHGGPGVLVQYYAKHLPGEWLKDAKLAKAEKLRLDVIPTIDGGKLTIGVTYDGKPAAKNEVVVIDPADKRHELVTDAAGKVVVPGLTAGSYAIRAGNIETDKGGERDGKKYLQTWHYSTLTFDVPTSVVVGPAPKQKQADPTAVAALAKARAGRAVWEAFPGFEADVTVTSTGVNVTGHVSIDSNGAVTLDFPEPKTATWLEEQLSSLVQHRMPDGEVTDGVITWADDDKTHPLGRLIDLGDPNLKSVYRLKDGVVMEVNRTAGPNMHFTIDVLEIERNAEGKYLPRSFTMNFFDNKTGEVKSSLACLNEWQRVGKYDLPKTFVEVNTKEGKSVTWRMEFTNAKLLN
jgi:uncharacterized GH25 family protein